MLSFRHSGVRLCDGLNRREWLRVGGLSMLGLSLTDLLRSQQASGATIPSSPLGAGLAGTMFGRAKSVIFLWLQGGPPQHETFDPKPDAPAEIRGVFKPIHTNVPGIHFCELLPRTAQRADKLAVIRSLHTDDNNHDVSGYWVLTGYPYGPGSARQIKPTDWPYLGSVIKMLKPNEKLPALTSVWLPDRMRLNDNVTPAGQTGGFLGGMWDPERFIGDPSSEDYRVEGLSLPLDISPTRMDNRAALLGQLNQRLQEVDRQGVMRDWDKVSQFAAELVTSGKAKDAFDLSKESAALRDRYGRHTWGQSCLLARRLVEAGVRLVHVNWPREPGDSAVDNPMWDTHAQNADRLQDVLCPIFDVSFAALLDDLSDRGLLDETLVVAVGEFGRTPKINHLGGRDHWGPVFCCALAGAGISGGQVFGASDKDGAYPIENPIRPHDLTATIFHLLGIPHAGVFHDRLNRPQLLTKGEPLYRLLGDEPATTARCQSTGDEAFVPPFDDSRLVDTEFSSGRLLPVTPASREKGWRASPIVSADAGGLGVRVAGESELHVQLGVFGSAATQSLAAGAKLILAQEIKSARGGQYTFTIRARGGGSSQAAFDQWFGGSLACRLELFRYSNAQKNALEATVLGSEPLRPADMEFGRPTEFVISRFLGSTVGGVNFATGNGLGVAVVIECKSPSDLGVSDAAYLSIEQVRLKFQAGPRNENEVA